MKKRKRRDYEAGLLERLTDADYAVGYLNAVLADSANDPSDFLAALRNVAKAKGRTIAELAGDANLGRQALYRALSKEGNPELATLTSVLRELGLRLAVESAA